MHIYDYRLKPVTPPHYINWSNLPQDDNFGLNSHLSYYLSRLNVNKKICLVTDNSFVNESLQEFFQRVNHSDVDYVVLNYSDHPLLSYLDNRELIKPLIVLGGNFKDDTHYPYWMMSSADWSKSDVVDFSAKKSYPVSIVNGKTRIPRMYTVVELNKRSYYGDVSITWGDVNRELSIEDGLHGIMENVHSGKDLGYSASFHLYKKFLDLSLNFKPDVTSVSKTKTNYFSVVANIEYGMDSYLQIVSESCPEEHGFVSEKIFKPLRGGQLFVVQGCAGTVQYLRNLGFDTFDDFIDHDSYDNEADWITRTSKMLSVLDGIYDNLENIYFKTTERRKANAELLRSGKLVDGVLSRLKDRFR